MLGVLARLFRRLSAAVHGLRGRLAYRFGRTDAARRQFERVLCLGGDEFTAFVHLGRIALGEGDFAGYRREMGHARASDPERFARLRPLAAGFDAHPAGTPFEETGERATWRSVRPGGPGGTRRSPVRSAEIPTESDEQAHNGPLVDEPVFELPRRETGPVRSASDASRDDFCTHQERERFRRMPPIRNRDVRATDVEDLARRFGS